MVLRLAVFERKPQQFGLGLCFPLMPVRLSGTTIVPKRPSQKLADSKAALHTVEAPQKPLVRNTLVTQLFDMASLNLVKGQHNPSLGACWESTIGKVQQMS